MIDNWTKEFVEDLEIKLDELIDELFKPLKQIHLKFVFDD